MRLDVRYISDKLLNKLYIRVFAGKKVNINMYDMSGQRQRARRILFYFDDSRFMHLGDHLFFEPVCRLFRNNGYSIAVRPTRAMVPYFEALGYAIDANGDMNTYDLIVSKPDFLLSLRQYLHKLFLVETACADIQQPLINDLLGKLQALFHLPAPVDARPAWPADQDNHFSAVLEDGGKYVLYNNYLNSGAFRVGSEKFVRLEQFMLEFVAAHPNVKVIHSGSAADRERDFRTYPFVDIDLRGKTSPFELFALVARPEVKHYVGFDNYLMHLFMMADKKAYVMSRGRWSPKERFFLENFIDPPFLHPDILSVKQYI
ncbi:hypothetical protein [Dinghuibacter silviterrae]|uniref:Uncharacterized protein n=1 Tax=Dinghuibacter silviterrae TaxID=1539049 RepID=A0A4R8DPM2_9BACT|nr:hypothetical protein [Dinghuibacter silviterrae]TDX00070.1 hypothetical protein EDB95_1086 [Dinghuibacter silviterrae]